MNYSKLLIRPLGPGVRPQHKRQNARPSPTLGQLRIKNAEVRQAPRACSQ